MTQLDHITDYLFELDLLKGVNRRTYIHDATRVENSAEHSWQLAMACWIFAEHLQDSFDVEKLLKLALIHDLGEIDAGDTFLYAAERTDATAKERTGIKRLAQHAGNTVGDLLPLWDEQENGSSKEARLMKVMDRLLPFLCNIKTQGRAWAENGVVRAQVEAAHAFIKDEAPEVHVWITAQLDIASAAGWLAE
jgi:putative hydrolase of HD superfamily